MLPKSNPQMEGQNPHLHKVPVIDITNPDYVELHQTEPPIAPEPLRFEIRSLRDIRSLPKPLKESDFYGQWHTRRVLYIPPVSQDIAFIVGWNPIGENCYWTAVSQIIYGLPNFWPWVKAHHKIYIREVLADRNHPRHGVYTVIGSKLNSQGETTLQALDEPNRWVPDEIYQVTADLYDIYLVKFTMLKNSPYIVSQVNSRGCRNARNMFLMLSNEFHYEPMRPIVKRPSEFQYPELSSSSLTTGSRKIEKLVRGDESDPLISASYRKHRTEEQVPEQLIPRPIIPQPSEADIADTIGGLQLPQKKFSTTPGWIPRTPAKTDNGSRKNQPSRKLHKATEYAGLTPGQTQENRMIYETLSDDELRTFCNRREIKINGFRDDRQNLIDDLLGDDALWTGKERVEDPPIDITSASSRLESLSRPHRPAPPKSDPLRHVSPLPISPTRAPEKPEVAPLTVDTYMKQTWGQLYDELKKRDYAGRTGNELYKLTKKVQMAKGLVELDQREAGKGEEQKAAKSRAATGQRRKRDNKNDKDAQDKQGSSKRRRKK